MKNYCVKNGNFDEAKYYAHELFVHLFEQNAPLQEDMVHLANALGSQSFNLTHYSELKSSYLKALIISSDLIEQNVLAMTLLGQQYQLTQVRTKKDLLIILSKQEHYDLVIFSEQFKEVGVGFIINFLLHAQVKPFAIYIGDALRASYYHNSFNAILSSFFSINNLKKIINTFDHKRKNTLGKVTPAGHGLNCSN